MAASWSKRTVNGCTVSQELLPVRTIPVHITQFFWNVNKYATLVEKCWHIPLSQPSDKWRRRNYSMDVEKTRAPDNSAPEIKLKKPPIPRRDPKLCLFASRIIGYGRVIGYFYTSLFYAKMTRERHNTKMYVESTMLITAKTLRKWTNELP